MKGYHFLRSDRKMQFPPYTKVETGKTYACKGKPVLCQNGLHACKRIIDALAYAPGPIVCGVELSGKIIHDTNKAVAKNRKVLWMLDTTNILHEFACRCAEDSLALLDNPDPRSIAAIKIKRDWVAGNVTDKELDAAAAAARAAAWDAAWPTAWHAARAAAWAAARAAAWDAAMNAARSAAWSAARERFNRRLTQMVSTNRRSP